MSFDCPMQESYLPGCKRKGLPGCKRKGLPGCKHSGLAIFVTDVYFSPAVAKSLPTDAQPVQTN